AIWPSPPRLPRTWRRSSAWWRSPAAGRSVVQPVERLCDKRLAHVGGQPRLQIEAGGGPAAVEPDGDGPLRGLGGSAVFRAGIRPPPPGADGFEHLDLDVERHLAREAIDAQLGGPTTPRATSTRSRVALTKRPSPDTSTSSPSARRRCTAQGTVGASSSTSTTRR